MNKSELIAIVFWFAANLVGGMWLQTLIDKFSDRHGTEAMATFAVTGTFLAGIAIYCAIKSLVLIAK